MTLSVTRPEKSNPSCNISTRVPSTASPTAGDTQTELVDGMASTEQNSHNPGIITNNESSQPHKTTSDANWVPNVENSTTKRKEIQSYWDKRQSIKMEVVKKVIQSYWDLDKIPEYRAMGSVEFRKCPSLNEKQQCISEYGLPLILPGIFYIMKLSPFGLRWCMTIVCGHTLETALTNFGPSVKSFRVWGCISPIVHHLIDCAWLQSLISAMVLVPHRFVVDDSGKPSDVWYVVYIALLLIQTLPIYLAVSFKTHYIKHRHFSDDKHNKMSITMIGMHLRLCFISYLLATACIYYSYYFTQEFLLKIGVLILNAAPIVLFTVYRIFLDTSSCRINN